MQKNITATIITLNERKHIREVILNVQKICNEVIVVDSFSSDETCSIAEELGARVIQQKYLGDGGQKAFCEQYASNEWILSIDADERLEEEAIAYLRDFDYENEEFEAYSFRRKSFIGEKFQSAAKMKKALSSRIPLTSPQLAIVLSSSKITQMDLTIDRINTLDSGKISDEQKAAIEKLSGESFIYQWQLADVLKLNAPSWKFHEGDEEFNKKLSRTYSYVYDHFGK